MVAMHWVKKGWPYSASAAIHAVAESMASQDGRLDDFKACQVDEALDEIEGRYSGYIADAEGLIENIERRGFVLSPSPVSRGGRGRAGQSLERKKIK
jgi:hypothetical protein